MNKSVNILMAASILLVGCDKQTNPSGEAAPLATDQGSAAPAAPPVTQPALTAWQQGDKTTAVSRFLEADWSVHPLFPASSPLGLSADQINALSAAEKEAKAGEMAAELGSLNALLVEVMQAGKAVAASGDTTQARRHFTALQQCGAALASPRYPAIVQSTGQGFEARAKAELTKIGK